MLADGGAKLNLSGISALIGPWRAEDRIDLLSKNGSLIDLSRARSIQAAGQSGQGVIRFTATGASADRATRSGIDLGPIESISHSLFDVKEGAHITAVIENDASGQYSSTRFARDLGDEPITIMRVTGVGSTLDLPPLVDINAGFDSRNSHEDVQLIVAEKSAKLGLARVRTLTGPWRAEDRLDVIAQNGGDIDLSDLRTIQPAGVSGAGVISFSAQKFDIDRSSRSRISLGPFETVKNTKFNVVGSSEIVATADGLPSGKFDSTRFSQSLNGQPSVVMGVSDPGSVLDLAPLAIFNAGFDSRDSDEDVQRVIADRNGWLGLDGLRSIVGPWRAEDRLEFVAKAGGTIHLSGLEEITTIGNGTGTIRFEADGGTLVLGNLNEPENTEIILTDSNSFDPN